jgi:transcription-repair coupling factor (superfamily II helicase)
MEVEDVRREWEDRYGPVPAAAEALLEVARLRAECVRTGVREVTVTKGTGFGGPKYVARISPVTLATSKTIRLERLYKGAVYKADQAQLQLPLATAAGAAQQLVEALADLLPPPKEQAVEGTSPTVTA